MQSFIRIFILALFGGPTRLQAQGTTPQLQLGSEGTDVYHVLAMPFRQGC